MNQLPNPEVIFLKISNEKVSSKTYTVLVLSRFSRVRLFVTPWTAAYQAPPSMGFSRQEYWSGVPLPFPEGIETQFILGSKYLS